MLALISRATGLYDTGMVHRQTQNALESLNGGAFRVMLSPFYLVLAKTPEELDDAEMDDLFGVISSVVETYTRRQLEETSTTMQYIFLRDMVGKFGNEQTTLSFPLGGIAQFSQGDIITTTNLDEWTQYALEYLLPGVLQRGGAESPSLSGVEFSVYLIDRQSNGTLDDTPLAPDQSDKENNHFIWAIVITVAATLAIVAAIALLVSRYYGPRRHLYAAKESASVQTSPEATSPASDRPALLQTLSGDDRSEGSFTVNTEAGDSTALKSINLASAKYSGIIEPYETTRVSVRKDMMASTWVESAPNTNAPQMESVLAPSHFVASKEEQDRRLRVHQQIQAEAWDDDEGDASPLRFESAHDEEEGKSAFLDSPASF